MSYYPPSIRPNGFIETKKTPMQKIKKLINNINRFFKDVWLGIKISNENYLSGKTNQCKF